MLSRQVEDTLYKIPQRGFLNSCFFTDLPEEEAKKKGFSFDAQLLPGWVAYQGHRDTRIYVNWQRREVSGSKTGAPILREQGVIALYDVNTAEFDSLLSLLYPSFVPFFQCASSIAF